MRDSVWTRQRSACSQKVATTGEMVIHEGDNNTDHGDDDDDYHIDIETIIATLVGMKPCWIPKVGTHSPLYGVRWTISALYGNT